MATQRAQDFEPTLSYLVNKLKSGLGSETEARKVIENAVRDATLPIKDGVYDISEFIEICNALKKQKGYPSFIANIVLTHAYLYKMKTR